MKNYDQNKRTIFITDEKVLSVMYKCPRKITLLCQIALTELIDKYRLDTASSAQLKKFFECYDFIHSSNIIPVFNQEQLVIKSDSNNKPVYDDNDAESLVNLSDKEKMANIMEMW